MTRDWKISLSVAILSHVGLLFAFKHVMPHPAQLTRETVIEITMIAAPAEGAPVEAPSAAVTPPPLAPTVEIHPSPEPAVEPEKPIAPIPVEPPPVAPPQPDVPKPIPSPLPSPTAPPMPPVKVAVKEPARVPTEVGDGSAPKPGPDTTTKRAEVGFPARPDYRRNPEPAYPPAARRRRQEGRVLLAVKVSAEGRATSVSLKQSSGYTTLDTAALEAVRDWEFVPARLGNVPIASDIEVPVRFQLTRQGDSQK